MNEKKVVSTHQVGINDLDGGFDKLEFWGSISRSMSELVLGLNWKKVSLFKVGDTTLELHQLKTKTPKEYHFIVGYMKMIPEDDPEKERFAIFGDMDMELTKTHILNKDYYEIYGVTVAKEYKGLGIAGQLYRFLLKDLKITIMSDSMQLFGMRKLWADPWQIPDLIVDVVDKDKGKVIIKDAVIVQGNTEPFHDNNSYSRSEAKQKMRFILKEII